ncbi:hypothetical protein [Oceanirhabdus sp. W0125-5]|uniref:hypothetical protein n=1 Tax=Oceanirhabdus sp. W0125-5 TaxID=2999116 RepID=UPI0022F33226|nr:hypothetical protein [Oceanirhabdus sp. W0125-5]WBW96675.1 hypothetical protein OW730_23725 [Oceanirhabdus sp. W0125-5]
MIGIVFTLFSIFFILISSFLTYVAFKQNKSITLRFIPSFMCLLGILFFGIGPYIFNYAKGITLGLIFLFLGIFSGIAFWVSVITLIYLMLIYKNNDRIK